jgi:phospholipase/carboxylesterase
LLRRLAAAWFALCGVVLCGCETAAPPPVPKPVVSGHAVILMHGRGASADDLQPLADQLSTSAPKVKFVLPAGPLRFGPGLAWYPRTSDTASAAMDQARVRARGVVMDAVKQLRKEGFDDPQIYVGGFSQGATLALDMVLSPEGSRLGGLISLSGGVLELDLSQLQRRAKLRAFVSHGTADSVLDISTSQRLVAALQQYQHPVQFVEFDGAHTIPTIVRERLGAFLAAD